MGHGLPAAGHDAVTELDDLGDANDLLGVIAFVGQQDQEEKDVRNNGLGLPRDRNALSDTSLSNPAARPTDTARRCSTWSASSHGGEALQLPAAPHSSGEGVRPGRHGRLSRAPRSHSCPRQECDTGSLRCFSDDLCSHSEMEELHSSVMTRRSPHRRKYQPLPSGTESCHWRSVCQPHRGQRRLRTVSLRRPRRGGLPAETCLATHTQHQN